MNNLVTKLSSVAALIGVIAAIGGGFIQYGKIQAKLTELDKRKSVVNQTVDLGPVNDKISTLEVELIDRIEKVDGKINPNTDITPLQEAINQLENKIDSLRQEISELKKEVAITSKENELQDVLIEEIKTKSNNPLAN